MIEEMKPLIKKLTIFAKNRFGFKRPPKLFLKKDLKNCEAVLGKTAHYDPSNESITIFISNRHPKDILRSYSHELIHHCQNERGDLSPEKMKSMSPSYAQEDDHMRNMEKEAYLEGNMCFRDFEDGLKNKYKYIYKLAESKFLKENKNMTTKITKEFLKKKVREVLEEKISVKPDNKKNKELEPEKNVSLKAEGDEVEEGNGAASDIAPGHYCIHHGGVQYEGKIMAAEAVQHVEPDENGFISHYDMKLTDGTILEDIAAEEIQVTNASLAEEHKRSDGHKAMKKKKSKSKKDKEVGKNSIKNGYDNNPKVTKADFIPKKKMAAEQVNTPEGEGILYEERFTPRNTKLFEKLLKEWTK